jgi:putative FmdB family regulatory protein
MPIYEYRCENGHTFDVLQSMSDDPVTTCETCEAPVQRVLHSPAVHFKGSGFYTTDYGSKKRPKGGEASDSGPKSDGGSKSGGDSKSSDSGSGSSGSGDKAKASSGSKD